MSSDTPIPEIETGNNNSIKSEIIADLNTYSPYDISLMLKYFRATSVSDLVTKIYDGGSEQHIAHMYNKHLNGIESTEMLKESIAEYENFYPADHSNNANILLAFHVGNDGVYYELPDGSNIKMYSANIPIVVYKNIRDVLDKIYLEYKNKTRKELLNSPDVFMRGFRYGSGSKMVSSFISKPLYFTDIYRLLVDVNTRDIRPSQLLNYMKNNGYGGFLQLKPYLLTI